MNELFRGLDPDRIIAPDDSPEKLQRNHGNLLRIAPFFGDPSDPELLCPIADTVHGCNPAAISA